MNDLLYYRKVFSLYLVKALFLLEFEQYNPFYEAEIPAYPFFPPGPVWTWILVDR